MLNRKTALALSLAAALVLVPAITGCQAQDAQNSEQSVEKQGVDVDGENYGLVAFDVNGNTFTTSKSTLGEVLGAIDTVDKYDVLSGMTLEEMSAAGDNASEGTSNGGTAQQGGSPEISQEADVPDGSEPSAGPAENGDGAANPVDAALSADEQAHAVEGAVEDTNANANANNSNSGESGDDVEETDSDVPEDDYGYDEDVENTEEGMVDEGLYGADEEVGEILPESEIVKDVSVSEILSQTLPAFSTMEITHAWPDGSTLDIVAMNFSETDDMKASDLPVIAFSYAEVGTPAMSVEVNGIGIGTPAEDATSVFGDPKSEVYRDLSESLSQPYLGYECDRGGSALFFLDANADVSGISVQADQYGVEADEPDDDDESSQKQEPYAGEKRVHDMVRKAQPMKWWENVQGSLDGNAFTLGATEVADFSSWGVGTIDDDLLVSVDPGDNMQLFLSTDEYDNGFLLDVVNNTGQRCRVLDCVVDGISLSTTRVSVLPELEINGFKLSGSQSDMVSAFGSPSSRSYEKYSYRMVSDVEIEDTVDGEFSENAEDVENIEEAVDIDVDSSYKTLDIAFDENGLSNFEIAV